MFTPVDNSAVSFVGRLANEILRMTDTRSTSFIEQMSAWYDKRTMAEVLNIKIWEQLKVLVYTNVCVFICVLLCTVGCCGCVWLECSR